MITPETVEVGRSRGRTVLANWGPTLLFNVALPMFTYYLLTGMGVGAVPALLASGVWPVVEMGLSLAVRRHLDEISMIVLIFIILGVVAGVGFNSARLIQVKESVVTGLFGLIALASLAMPRPLMFYF